MENGLKEPPSEPHGLRSRFGRAASVVLLGASVLVVGTADKTDPGPLPATLAWELANAYTSCTITGAHDQTAKPTVRLDSVFGLGSVLNPSWGPRNSIVVDLDAPQNPLAEHNPGPGYFIRENPLAAIKKPVDQAAVAPMGWATAKAADGTPQAVLMPRQAAGRDAPGHHLDYDIFVGVYDALSPTEQGVARYCGTVAVGFRPNGTVASVGHLVNPAIPVLQDVAFGVTPKPQTLIG